MNAPDQDQDQKQPLKMDDKRKSIQDQDQESTEPNQEQPQDFLIGFNLEDIDKEDGLNLIRSLLR
jgi:Tfp pilus assembly protein PilP